MALLATLAVVSGSHHHPAPGQSPAVGLFLGGDVHHAGPAQRVEVGQATIVHLRHCT